MGTALVIRRPRLSFGPMHVRMAGRVYYIGHTATALVIALLARLRSC